LKRVDYALNYAARGWKVLALQPNTKVPIKTALQEHGSKDATDIPDKIRILWGEFPNANIGIATGKQSGLTVLDMDDLEVRHEIEKLPGFVPSDTDLRSADAARLSPLLPLRRACRAVGRTGSEGRYSE